jgi:hypothetical protein
MPGAPVTHVVTPARTLLFVSDGRGNLLGSYSSSPARWAPWRTHLPAATTAGAPLAAVPLSPDAVSLFLVDRDGSVGTVRGLFAT